MSDSLVEAEVIPLWAKRRGLTRCFFYTGSSMTPTFREGHILYVAPEARDVAVGDVVVFWFPADSAKSLSSPSMITWM